ncbi:MULTISPECIES: MauE/DoxX family redox-associated membrane protein [unclassified Microbacterium]|uniref:MauE/DoxX family redox-associated membrane protein n=1 Tax=unclassified Microbacterium TaxID=2609290 RepID=UPI0015E41CA9|nr:MULTISPECIES: MauE/DoxX family redox-associated membrane protein [unclassified Microbacterium]
MPVLIYSLSALVGLILAVTGVIKLREGQRPLGQAIETFRVVPAAAVRPIAAVLPPLELAVGLALVAGIAGPWALAAVALIVVYTASVISVITRKISTDCGCFGSVLKSRANWVVVGRNVVLLLALAPSLLWPITGFVDERVGWALVGLGFLIGLVRMFTPVRHSQKTEEESAPQSRVAVNQIGD